MYDPYCLGCDSGVGAPEPHICENGFYHPHCELFLDPENKMNNAARSIQRIVRGRKPREKIKTLKNKRAILLAPLNKKIPEDLVTKIRELLASGDKKKRVQTRRRGFKRTFGRKSSFKNKKGKTKKKGKKKKKKKKKGKKKT